MFRLKNDAAQFVLPLAPPRTPDGPRRVPVLVGGRAVDVEFVRHRRARHYILRVADDGGLRVTIPWGGSRAAAERFLQERRAWIERERYRRAVDGSGRGRWSDGTPILFRGAPVTLRAETSNGNRVRVTFADQVVAVPSSAAGDLRPGVEAHLRRLAARELPARLAELADAHSLTYAAVSIRNQRSRWGSCSPSGRISLNWRLIQLPPSVADYVLLHELAHLRHLNHSARFWKEVERLCPNHREARAWLRANHGLRVTGI